MAEIKLANSQLDKLSDLSLGLGQMFFGSTVLPYIIPSIDKPPFLVLLFGLTTAILLWISSLLVVRKLNV